VTFTINACEAKIYNRIATIFLLPYTQAGFELGPSVPWAVARATVKTFNMMEILPTKWIHSGNRSDFHCLFQFNLNTADNNNANANTNNNNANIVNVMPPGKKRRRRRNTNTDGGGRRNDKSRNRQDNDTRFLESFLDIFSL
jgi:hypothetical protein